MLFLIQTAVIFLILHFIPGLGDAGDQGRTAVLTAISAIASGALTFLWDLLSAPVALDRERAKDFGKLRDIVQNGQLQEEACDQLSQFYERGMTLYHDYAEFDEWAGRMEAWSDEVAGYIASRFMLSAKYRFLYPLGSGEYITEWSWEGVEGAEAFKVKSRYTGRLGALRDAIMHAPSELSVTKLGAVDLIEQ